MSTLYLVRHGQASFGTTDPAAYDVLSAIGARQAHQLGVYWAARGLRIDSVYIGPRRRHIDTASHFVAGVRSAASAGHDTPVPEPIELSGLDEYPALELLQRWLPVLAAEDPDLARSFGPGADRRQFEHGFRRVVDKWSRGELDTGELESYTAFHERVQRALDQIMVAEGRGKHVVVFTSGGPIAMAMQRALGLAGDVALRVAWVLANASVSEFRYRDPSELTMVTFNTTPHLQDSALLTYR